MSVAYAAVAAEGSAAFYDAPEFWVMVAFVLTVALVGKTIVQKISTALDQRSEGIRTEIEEATRLREEAQDLLASYERKQRGAAEETRKIAERAKSEADYLSKKAAEDLNNLLARRERQAKDRIAQAEAAAIDDVRAAAIDLALAASRRMLVEKVTGSKADALIDAAIE
ncbi:MAG TPA: F0F1 ATP synthase subunit B, partial [Rhodospirillales bacterium]|nr:F0F1 ATP synthase subunit B [Rhodospirillales bacterium]